MTDPGPLVREVANTFRSSTYNEVITTRPLTLFRVWGGSATEGGHFWTTQMPLGPLQSRMDLALNPAWGNSATNVSTRVVPQGTTLFMGPASGQGPLFGGGIQVYVP